MAEYTNARSYPVELNTGQMLAPGATENIDAENAHNLALIDAGDLVLYDADTPPENPDDLYRGVPRRLFLGDQEAPPASMDRGGDVLIDPATGEFLQRDAEGNLAPRLSTVTEERIGAANGVASLDSATRLPAAQLPVEADLLTALPSVESRVPTAITVNARDANGNITSITEGGVTTTYTYDIEDRVVTETRFGVTRTFSYDTAGDLLGAVVA